MCYVMFDAIKAICKLQSWPLMASCATDTGVTSDALNLVTTCFALRCWLLCRVDEDVIADAFEALVGAIYLDRGLQAASTFVITLAEVHNISNKFITCVLAAWKSSSCNSLYRC